MEERRQSPRNQAKAPILGLVRSNIRARIVDISESGLQLELASTLRPGLTCDVTVPTKAGLLQLRGTVRRCQVRSQRGDQGIRLVYLAGLEFVGLTEQDRRALATGLDPAGSKTLEVGGGANADLKWRT